MRSWALLFFPRGKKSNQKKRAAVCELVLRTGTLRSSARFKADPTAARYRLSLNPSRSGARFGTPIARLRIRCWAMPASGRHYHFALASGRHYRCTQNALMPVSSRPITSWCTVSVPS